MFVGETYSWVPTSWEGSNGIVSALGKKGGGTRENRVHQRKPSVFYGGGERRRRGHPRELQILRRVQTC